MESYLHIHFSLIYTELVHLALLQEKKCLIQSAGVVVTVLLGKVFATAMPRLLHITGAPPKSWTKGWGVERRGDLGISAIIFLWRGCGG